MGSLVVRSSSRVDFEDQRCAVRRIRLGFGRSEAFPVEDFDPAKKRVPYPLSFFSEIVRLDSALSSSCGSNSRLNSEAFALL